MFSKKKKYYFDLESVRELYDEKTLAASRIETKQNELETEYNKFVEKLNSDRENLKNSLLSQMPLFKESLKAKFSKL